jgi:hypothetical protein
MLEVFELFRPPMDDDKKDIIRLQLRDVHRRSRVNVHLYSTEFDDFVD